MAGVVHWEWQRCFRRQGASDVGSFVRWLDVDVGQRVDVDQKVDYDVVGVRLKVRTWAEAAVRTCT